MQQAFRQIARATAAPANGRCRPATTRSLAGADAAGDALARHFGSQRDLRRFRGCHYCGRCLGRTQFVAIHFGTPPSSDRSAGVQSSPPLRPFCGESEIRSMPWARLLIVHRFETGSGSKAAIAAGRRRRCGLPRPAGPVHGGLARDFRRGRAAMAGTAGLRSSADRCGPAS